MWKGVYEHSGTIIEEESLQVELQEVPREHKKRATMFVSLDRRQAAQRSPSQARIDSLVS